MTNTCTNRLSLPIISVRDIIYFLFCRKGPLALIKVIEHRKGRPANVSQMTTFIPCRQLTSSIGPPGGCIELSYYVTWQSYCRCICDGLL